MQSVIDVFARQRLERLEQQYRRAQFLLSGALAAYEHLNALADVSDTQRQQAWQRVRKAREQLLDIQCTMEYVEDYESMYGVPQA